LITYAVQGVLGEKSCIVGKSILSVYEYLLIS